MRKQRARNADHEKETGAFVIEDRRAAERARERRQAFVAVLDQSAGRPEGPQQQHGAWHIDPSVRCADPIAERQPEPRRDQQRNPARSLKE